jgi:hypothetical protein
MIEGPVLSNHGINASPGNVKILFLGQCLQYGYQGVSRYATYTSVAASILTAQFPGIRLKFDLKYLYHPTGLKALLRHRLAVTKPDLVVINLPAMFAATAWRVNMVYQIAPELVDTARTFARKVEAKVKGLGPSAPRRDTMLDKVFSLKPPIEIAEYERLVADAVSMAKQVSSCRIILMGPGLFNEDTVEHYEVHSPELWESVNEMILRLAKRFNLPMIDAQNALIGNGGGVFVNQNHRFSEHGHSLVGREVASVLAGEIRLLSLGNLSITNAARA